MGRLIFEPRIVLNVKTFYTVLNHTKSYCEACAYLQIPDAGDCHNPQEVRLESVLYFLNLSFAFLIHLQHYTERNDHLD